MDFDSDTFQKLIGDCGCGEQYRSWLIHHDLSLEDWFNDEDAGFDRFNFNHYHPDFIDFVMTQA